VNPQISNLRQQYLIWILVPSIPNLDSEIGYYYDFDQSHDEYSRCFKKIGFEWRWKYITQGSYIDQLKFIKSESLPKEPLIINLCDGDEVNGAPGIEVIKELKNLGLIFTGAEEYFYEITTSKIPMKKVFDQFGINTPKWDIVSTSGDNLSDIFKSLKSPLILKPAVSGGSMGLGIKNVVHNELEAKLVLDQLQSGYKGWKLDIDGFILEEFIPGKEFTTLLTGSYDHPSYIRTYTPVERVFSQKIPATERILSYDRLWETYEEENELDHGEFLFNYFPCDPDLSEKINQLSLDVFHSLKGTGYTRIDIRQHEKNGLFYVLEANAQCGLSEDENYTSIGAILRISGISFSELITEIILDALRKKIL